MKKIILVLILICWTSLAYAGIDSIGGYAWTPVTKTYSTEGTTSGVVVWRPASGHKIVLMGAMISYSGVLSPNPSVEIETAYDSTFKFGTDVIPPVDVTSGPVVIGTGSPIWKGGADATLTISIGGIQGGSMIPAITLWGYETTN